MATKKKKVEHDDMRMRKPNFRRLQDHQARSTQYKMVANKRVRASDYEDLKSTFVVLREEEIYNHQTGETKKYKNYSREKTWKN